MAYNRFREGAINAMAPFAGGYEAMLALDALLDYLTEHDGEWADQAALIKHHSEGYGPPVSQALVMVLRGESDQ